MSAAARYALYLAPPPESALHRFGARVLGRDAHSGATVKCYAPAGYDPALWRAMTGEARRYGFHATLKAPFRLSEGFRVEDLEAAVAALAHRHARFSAGPLQVSTLSFGAGGGFLALTPAARAPALAALEADAVQQLDCFRAPMTEAERLRRRPDRLTARQREMLDRWGYPHVLDQFRLHFTLSNAIAEPDALVRALAADFADEVGDPSYRVDELTLFVEDAPGAAFRAARRFALRADGAG
jgi:Protein of unknown function (DUF1045)